MEVYLDNSATTKVRKEVIDKMVKVMDEEYGNPSSTHLKGYKAWKLLEESRERVCKFLNCGNKEEIIFTSGGTESNNFAIKSIAYGMKHKGKHIITSKIEHPSVLNVVKKLEEEGYAVTYLNVDSTGKIDLNQLKNAIDDNTILITVMGVNNEIGSIEPINEIAKIKRNYSDLYYHVDGVQAVGKIKLDLMQQDIDLLSLSGHKIHGPKGIGALYAKKGINMKPLIYGGGQEGNLRSGTENLPGIVGLGVACKLLLEEFDSYIARLQMLKKRLYYGIVSEIKDVHLNGPKIEDGAPQILNMSFLGVRGEVLLHALEERGIYVSTGSACSSHRNTESYVLKAIGLNHEQIEGAVRFSLGYFNTEKEIDYTVDNLKEQVKFLRKYVRR